MPLISCPSSPSMTYTRIRTIGLADADAVLALASDEQVRGLLDSDGWDRDELKMERLDPWLNALMRCGPDVLGQKLLSLDDSILTEVLKASVQVLVIEDPEDFDAPDVEHVRTPDGALLHLFSRVSTTGPTGQNLSRLAHED